MTPVLKYCVWTAAIIAAVGAIAAPKVLSHAKHGEGKPVSLITDKAAPGGGRKGDGEKSGKPLQVTTFLVQPVRFAETIESTGTLLAEEAVELQAEIAGKVTQFNFREGTAVRRGELLVKLNDADLQASLERTMHRWQVANLREQRLAKLLKQGVARQEEYDIASSELDIQKAESALIKAQIQKTEIRAPFDGVVGLRYVSEGAFINAATRVATLQRLDKLKLDFAVPEKYAARIRIGNPVTVGIVGVEHALTGAIYAYDPRIDSVTRSLLIRAVCPNPGGKLLPGAFAHVELTLAELNDAVLIPAVAVVPSLAEKIVYVVEHGKAQARPVTTGTRLESTIHILAGLQPGDEVITSGLQQVRAGREVMVQRANGISRAFNDGGQP